MLLTLVKLYTRDQELNVSIVPDGTDISSCIISQHFVLGYFLLSLRDGSSPRTSLPLKLMLMGGRRIAAVPTRYTLKTGARRSLRRRLPAASGRTFRT